MHHGPGRHALCSLVVWRWALCSLSSDCGRGCCAAHGQTIWGSKKKSAFLFSTSSSSSSPLFFVTALHSPALLCSLTFYFTSIPLLLVFTRQEQLLASCISFLCPPYVALFAPPCSLELFLNSSCCGFIYFFLRPFTYCHFHGVLVEKFLCSVHNLFFPCSDFFFYTEN